MAAFGISAPCRSRDRGLVSDRVDHKFESMAMTSTPSILNGAFTSLSRAMGCTVWFGSLDCFGEIAAWVAGISFMACGVFVSNAQNFIYLIGLAWMPWVVMYLRLTFHTGKWKYAAWTALVLWMMLTGSYPGISIIAFYCLLAYAIYFFVCQKLYQCHRLQTPFVVEGKLGDEYLNTVLICSTFIIGL
jgi:hypothetical protein